MFATSRTTIERARLERRSGNLPEVILWRALRQRPEGLKFRRQHPLGPYCLDFACLAARLAIEVDGEVHGRGDRPLRDAARDAGLERRGFATLRIPAAVIFTDLDVVLVRIVATCRERVPLHPAASRRGPPPRSGEVLKDIG